MSYKQRLNVEEVGMDMTKSLKKQLRILFPMARFVMDHFHIIAYLNRLIAQEYRFTIKYGNLTQEQKDKLPPRTKGLGIVKLLYQGGNYWRKSDYGKVRSVFAVMPKVAKLWYAKEEVRAIYKESLSKQEARERWQFVLTLLPDLAKNTLTEKLEEILNYFDNRTTTGFVEGVHTKIKLLKRLSYGLRNPQVYVEKLELGFVEHKKLISNH
jgi:transposase